MSADGCFSCGILTHTTDNCRSLDESFPFLPIGWRAERVGDEFILGPRSPVGPEDHEMGNDDWSGERGWSPGPAMPTDPNSQRLGRTVRNRGSHVMRGLPGWKIQWIRERDHGSV